MDLMRDDAIKERMRQQAHRIPPPPVNRHRDRDRDGGRDRRRSPDYDRSRRRGRRFSPGKRRSRSHSASSHGSGTGRGGGGGGGASRSRSRSRERRHWRSGGPRGRFHGGGGRFGAHYGDRDRMGGRFRSPHDFRGRDRDRDHRDRGGPDRYSSNPYHSAGPRSGGRGGGDGAGGGMPAGVQTVSLEECQRRGVRPKGAAMILGNGNVVDSATGEVLWTERRSRFDRRGDESGDDERSGRKKSRGGGGEDRGTGGGSSGGRGGSGSSSSRRRRSGSGPGEGDAEGGDKQGSDEERDPNKKPLTFKEFMLQRIDDPEVTPEEAQLKYDRYLTRQNKSEDRMFFDAHKDEEWFSERYDPVVIERYMEERATRAQNSVEEFWRLFVDNKFPEVHANVDDAANAFMRVKKPDEGVVPEDGKEAGAADESEEKDKDMADASKENGDDDEEDKKPKKEEGGDKAEDEEEGDKEDDAQIKDEPVAGGDDKKKQKKAAAADGEVKEKLDQDLDVHSNEEDSPQPLPTSVWDTSMEHYLKVLDDLKREREEELKEHRQEEEEPVATLTTTSLSGVKPKDEKDSPMKDASQEEEKDKENEDDSFRLVRAESSECDRFYQNSVFIQGIPLRIKREQIMAKFASEQGFRKLILSDPIKNGRRVRYGWVEFATQEDCSRVLMPVDQGGLNGSKLTDLYYMNLLPKQKSKRKPKFTPAESLYPRRVSSDLQQCLQLCKKFDTEDGIDHSKNPLFGDTVLGRIDEIRRLNILQLYLRHVHLCCYYCATRYLTEEHMFARCANTHTRKVPSELSMHVSESTASNPWELEQDGKVKMLLAEEPLSEERWRDVKDEEFLDKHVKQISDGKFRCLLCLKLFKGVVYVHKHIKNKHRVEMDKQIAEKRSEEMYENYRHDKDRLTIHSFKEDEERRARAMDRRQRRIESRELRIFGDGPFGPPTPIGGFGPGGPMGPPPAPGAGNWGGSGGVGGGPDGSGGGGVGPGGPSAFGDMRGAPGGGGGPMDGSSSRGWGDASGSGGGDRRHGGPSSGPSPHSTPRGMQSRGGGMEYSSPHDEFGPHGHHERGGGPPSWQQGGGGGGGPGGGGYYSSTWNERRPWRGRGRGRYYGGGGGRYGARRDYERRDEFGRRVPVHFQEASSRMVRSYTDVEFPADDVNEEIDYGFGDASDAPKFNL